MKQTLIMMTAGILALCGMATGQAIPWLSWTFLPRAQMDEIIGEASGETAWKTIASIAAFNRDRRPEEFSDMLLETRVVSGLLRDYGLDGIEVLRYPEGQAWDASKGELWEIKPHRRKLASFNDMVPMLAAWSSPTDTTADLVWVGRGTPEEIRLAKVEGKIVVTEGNILAVSAEACAKQGALGIVAISMLRPFFDPLQLPWTPVRRPRSPACRLPPRRPSRSSGSAFPPERGTFSKKRLLGGESITVRAQVEARTVSWP